MNAQQVFEYVSGLETYVNQLEANTKQLEIALVTAENKIPEPWEAKAAAVIAIAKMFDALQIPYVYGGRSRTGMDCSGFVKVIYAQVGINFTHSASAQTKVGEQIDKNNSAIWRPGDLLGFDYKTNGSPDHIGIYMGNGLMIHTNTPASGINIKAVNSRTSGLISVNRVLK